MELRSGLSADQVGERLRNAADELGRNKRVLAYYLAEMEDRQLYQVSGHGSTVHFGDAQLDLEPRRTREYIQVGRALQDLVLLDESDLGWSKVTALLPVGIPASPPPRLSLPTRRSTAVVVTLTGHSPTSL